jgi:hypothetical protein
VCAGGTDGFDLKEKQQLVEKKAQESKQLEDQKKRLEGIIKIFSERGQPKELQTALADLLIQYGGTLSDGENVVTDSIKKRRAQIVIRK